MTTTPGLGELRSHRDAWRSCKSGTAVNQNEHPLKNQHGFFMINLAIFVLLLVGVWFLWHSYSQGRLQNDALSIFNDYSEAITKHILPKIRQ
jgi:hypothetical protein